MIDAVSRVTAGEGTLHCALALCAQRPWHRLAHWIPAPLVAQDQEFPHWMTIVTKTSRLIWISAVAMPLLLLAAVFSSRLYFFAVLALAASWLAGNRQSLRLALTVSALFYAFLLFGYGIGKDMALKQNAQASTPALASQH